MISLLLTLFISMFSICPSNYQVEDHNENNEIVINEETPIYNIGSLDEYGVQIYMFLSDFYSNNFIIDFIGALGGKTGSPNNYLSYSNTDTGELGLDTSGSILSLNNSYQVSSVAFSIKALEIRKFDTALLPTQYSDPMITSCYYLTFYNNNNNAVLRFFYRIMYPLMDDYEHELGTQVIYTEKVIDTITSTYGAFWCYYENTLDDDYVPMITYYYDYYVQNRINIINDNYNRGYNDGRSYGYQTGYNQALADSQAYDTTASTIFNGALEIGLLPVNFFLSIFNFEVFGLNIKSIVSALLTLAVVIIIVRFLFGEKNDK